MMTFAFSDKPHLLYGQRISELNSVVSQGRRRIADIKIKYIINDIKHLQGTRLIQIKSAVN